MKVGMSLLAESSDGVSEIPSTQEQQPEEVQVAIPVIVEPLISDENISLEDLTELRNSIEKAQGVNKDFVLSMEAIAPGITKEAGLHINGFTECLSKINYDETLHVINSKLNYSEEGLKEFIKSVKDKFTGKGFSKEEIKSIFDSFQSFINADITHAHIWFEKSGDKITLMVGDQKTIKNFIFTKDYKNKKKEFEDTIKSTSDSIKPLMESKNLRDADFDFTVDNGKMIDVKEYYYSSEENKK